MVSYMVPYLNELLYNRVLTLIRGVFFKFQEGTSPSIP